MKVAVSAAADNRFGEVDQRFGRARWFLLFDTETEREEVVNNSEAAEAPSGAGVASAQMLIDRGMDCVLTGRCGPNASRVLERAGVKVIQGVTGAIADALESLKRGEL